MMQEALHNTGIISKSSSARQSDRTAIRTLFDSQNDELTRFVAVRLDSRLKGRLDAEDVAQDTWLQVVGRLSGYDNRSDLPFPDWLKHVALDCLSHCHRTHITARKRSIRAEVRQNGINGGPPCCALVDQAFSEEESPGSKCDRREIFARVKRLIDGLPECDQQIIRLRIIEKRSARDVALVLSITEAAVRLRQFRLLRWLHDSLEAEPASNPARADFEEPDANHANTIWIINRDHQLLRSTPTGWELLPGLAREIALGADGSAWCLSASDFAPGGASIHVWNGHDWDHVDGAAVKIAVGPDGQPWIVNSAGNIFRGSGEGWELLPGLAREIAIGVDGTVWCLCAGATPSGDSSIHLWNGFDWDHVPGAAVKIAAGPPGAVWLVNAQHQIFCSS
jgi:RNA polymerase sigma-70 factor (subfamily 1)